MTENQFQVTSSVNIRGWGTTETSPRTLFPVFPGKSRAFRAAYEAYGTQSGGVFRSEETLKSRKNERPGGLRDAV